MSSLRSRSAVHVNREKWEGAIGENERRQKRGSGREINSKKLKNVTEKVKEERK